MDRGFTLVELLIVTAILMTLMALAAPALLDAVSVADQVTCASNLRQLGTAAQLYTKDHEGWFFPLRQSAPGGVLWYFGFEPNGSPALGEGNRTLDRTQAAFYPYLESPESVEICPAVPFGRYKPKFRGGGWTYGVNLYLSFHNGAGNLYWIRSQDAGRTALFADAAQVNTFQPPASPSNPLAEDWYYIEPQRRYVQFRHGGQANVLFADWHVDAVGPEPGSLDPRLPEARIGWLDEERVLLKPARWRMEACRRF